MICRYCSHPTPDTAPICPSCGQPTGVVGSFGPPPPTSVQSPGQPYQGWTSGSNAPGQPAPGQPYQAQPYPGQPDLGSSTPSQPYGQGIAPQPAVYASAGAHQRIVYILLGLFLGGFGIHNFYAGYHGRGIAQLLITLLLSWWLVFPAFGVFIWVIIEICTVTQDSSGAHMT